MRLDGRSGEESEFEEAEEEDGEGGGFDSAETFPSASRKSVGRGEQHQ